MAKKFGFFNSIGGDRKYLASDLSLAFDIGITTGLKAEEGNLQVVPYQGMQVQIQPGSAMIHGHFFVNDEPEIVILDVADPELNRIDRVVLRYDAYAREINTAVIKGTPAVNPNPPARLETPEQFDLVLADIYIPAGAVEINQSNITDMRDSPLCGYIGVKGAVSQLEFDAHLSENSGKHITESGENVNGRYIKFDDGTMIIQKIITGELGSQEIPRSTVVLPATFIDRNVSGSMGGILIFEGASLRDHGSIAEYMVAPISTSTVGVQVKTTRPVTPDRHIQVGLMLVGRWK